MATEMDVHALDGIALFADLTPAQIQKVEHAFDEHWFEVGERAQRQGMPSSGFYVILAGEAERRVDGEPISGRDPDGRAGDLRRGDWFGELAILFDEPALTDVVALQPLHTIALRPGELNAFLHDYPQVMYRLLLGEARRLRAVR
jgi:CRP-like cAMP-binding protein